MITIAAENFIKAVYKFENRSDWDSRPGTIARELGITNAAATDMARKLARKNLLDYQKYKQLKLSPAGRKLALGIIRKHRLWETFLYRTFNLSLHEIHREAEQLEHLTSDFLAEKINSFLGNPSTDPHGDPIPTEQGELLPDDKSVILSSAEPGQHYEISRLSGSDQEFFDFCNANNLVVGTVISVKKQYEKNRMTEIEIDRNKLLLNSEVGGIIFIKKMIED